MRIWFNRWFSELYNFVDLIKNNEDNISFEVYVSHTDKYSLSLQNADKSFIEPNLNGKEYIDYCIDFCKEHSIEILVPSYRYTILFSENVQAFENIGVKVLVPHNTSLIKLIEDKAAFYTDIHPKNIINIPDFYVVNTSQGFIDAYNKLSLKGDICFKPVHGVGGVGFRRIINNPLTIKNILTSTSSRDIPLNSIMTLVIKEKVFDDILMSTFLDGDEYSIDTLADAEGNFITAIPRKKINSYYRFIENNEELISIAKKLSDTYRLPFIYNIQIKYKNNIPYLIEINVRMAGGTHYANEVGINLPYLAIKALLGHNIAPISITENKMIAYKKGLFTPTLIK